MRHSWNILHSGQPCTLHQACLYRLVEKMQNSQGGQRFVFLTITEPAFVLCEHLVGSPQKGLLWALLLCKGVATNIGISPMQCKAIYCLWSSHGNQAKNKQNQMVVIPSIGGFRAAKLPGQATHMRWSCYAGNARTCLGLELPVIPSHWLTGSTSIKLATQTSTLTYLGGNSSYVCLWVAHSVSNQDILNLVVYTPYKSSVYTHTVPTVIETRVPCT